MGYRRGSEIDAEGVASVFGVSKGLFGERASEGLLFGVIKGVGASEMSSWTLSMLISCCPEPSLHQSSPIPDIRLMEWALSVNSCWETLITTISLTVKVAVWA